MELVCCICLGRQRPQPKQAMTVINGQAVCQEHISFAIRGKDYAEAIDLAIFQNELRRKRMDYVAGRSPIPPIPVAISGGEHIHGEAQADP